MSIQSDFVAQMNAETDRRFLDETGHAEPLDPRNHADARLIRRWLEIRYEVAQEANRATHTTRRTRTRFEP